MKILAVLLLLAVAQIHGRQLLDVATDCTKDNKCHKPVSPKYEVTGQSGGTEIREYANATWAVSSGKSVFGPDAAAVWAAKGLVAYFTGANNQHKTLPISIPVVTTILGPPHHHGPKHDKNGSHPHPHPPKGGRPDHPDHPHNGSHHDHPEHPHNGSEHHHPHPPPPRGPIVISAAFVDVKGDVPFPDDPHVKLISTNTTKVYAHEFSGFALSWFIKKEIDHLKKDLKTLGVKSCKGKFFVAAYDGPFKLFNRKNEVWWTELPKPKHHHKDDLEDGPKHMPEEFQNEDFHEEFQHEEFHEDFHQEEERFGFDQFDAEYLFFEEEPAKEGEEFDGNDRQLNSTGDWTFENGKDTIEEMYWTSYNGRESVDELIALS